MENKTKKVIELEILDDLEYSGVEAIALVDSPAIEKNWLFFKKEKFVEPKSGETREEYLSRCIPYQLDEGKEQDQAVAICISTYENMSKDFEFAAKKISFDFDDTLSTQEGLDLAKEYKANGDILYIISARNTVGDSMIARADELGIPHNRVFATGSNKAKVEKVKELGIDLHIDNNADVISELGDLGLKFGIDTSGLAPYTQQTPKRKSDLVEESINFSKILETAGNLGFKAEELTFNGLEFHSEEEFDIKLAKGYTVYKYSGSIGGNTRDFCRSMMNLDRFYTYDEIAQMGSQAVNPGFGEGGSDTYSIWKYKGGPNCKHAWRKFYITEAGAIQNKGLATGTAGEKPIDMPNQGYVNPPSERFFSFADESKREIIGPAAIPNIEIPRKDDNGEIYFVKFSEDVVKRMSEKFLKERRTHETNIQHVAEDNAGTYITQSWLVEDPTTDKANTIYGLDVPKGTWMVAAKVTDETTWQKIKAGDLKGWSIEGSFVSKEEYQDYIKDKKIWDNLKNLVSKW